MDKPLSSNKTVQSTSPDLPQKSPPSASRGAEKNSSRNSPTTADVGASGPDPRPTAPQSVLAAETAPQLAAVLSHNNQDSATVESLLPEDVDDDARTLIAVLSALPTKGCTLHQHHQTRQFDPSVVSRLVLRNFGHYDPGFPSRALLFSETSNRPLHIVFLDVGSDPTLSAAPISRVDRRYSANARTGKAWKITHFEDSLIGPGVVPTLDACKPGYGSSHGSTGISYSSGAQTPSSANRTPSASRTIGKGKTPARRGKGEPGASRAKKGKEPTKSNEDLIWVCPFFRANLKKYERCLTKTFHVIAHLKTHLVAEHRALLCQICFLEFSSQVDLDAHVSAFTCIQARPRKVDGLDTSDLETLKNLRISDNADGWNKMWGIMAKDRYPPPVPSNRSPLIKSNKRAEEFLETHLEFVRRQRALSLAAAFRQDYQRGLEPDFDVIVETVLDEVSNHMAAYPGVPWSSLGVRSTRVVEENTPEGLESVPDGPTQHTHAPSTLSSRLSFNTSSLSNTVISANCYDRLDDATPCSTALLTTPSSTEWDNSSATHSSTFRNHLGVPDVSSMAGPHRAKMLGNDLGLIQSATTMPLGQNQHMVTPDPTKYQAVAQPAAGLSNSHLYLELSPENSSINQYPIVLNPWLGTSNLGVGFRSGITGISGTDPLHMPNPATIVPYPTGTPENSDQNSQQPPVLQGTAFCHPPTPSSSSHQPEPDMDIIPFANAYPQIYPGNPTEMYVYRSSEFAPGLVQAPANEGCIPTRQRQFPGPQNPATSASERQIQEDDKFNISMNP